MRCRRRSSRPSARRRLCRLTRLTRQYGNGSTIGEYAFRQNRRNRRPSAPRPSRRPARYLFSTQDAEGYWCGELEADTTLESDYIFLHTLLGTRNEERFHKAIREIARHQNEDGGWPIYQGGPSNISASVKAYFAFKLCGHSA